MHLQGQDVISIATQKSARALLSTGIRKVADTHARTVAEFADLKSSVVSWRSFSGFYVVGWHLLFPVLIAGTALFLPLER